jgi:ubiquinone/menaquinone biosynthesis C-methylase UbiE
MDKNLQEWRDSAPYWEKYSSTIRVIFAPLTAALIEEARIGAGDKVLDVAGGSGEPSLTIAEVVGPEGAVTFTDPIAKMVSATKAEAQRRGLTNLEFHQCPAESLPFAADSFDAVVCRLGAMFFPDPLTALREMLRVAKPLGELSLAVWYKSNLNPYFYEVTEVVSRYIPAPTAPAATNDAFRFAEPGNLAAILQQAGATEVRERVLEFEIAAPVSLEEFWDFRSEISGTLREKLQSVSPEVRRRIKEDVLNATAKYFPQNQMRFPAQMLLVTGTKPS